jgi:hypothetical protein
METLEQRIDKLHKAFQRAARRLRLSQCKQCGEWMDDLSPNSDHPLDNSCVDCCLEILNLADKIIASAKKHSARQKQTDLSLKQACKIFKM